MTRRLPALLLALGALAAVSPALAQDAPKDPPPKDTPGYVRLVPKEGGWTVTDLFESIYRATGKSILYDPKTVQLTSVKVEFVGDAIIPEDQLFEWLQAVLSYHKLVLVPVGPKGPTGEQQWFAMDQANPALQSRPVYVDEEDIHLYAERDGLYIVTSINLQHVSDTTRVRAALAQLATKTAAVGRVLDIQGSRSIIVADFAPMVAAVKRLMQYIDRENPTVDPQMQVRQLHYAVASELAPIIQDLIDQSTTTSGSGRQPRQPQEFEEPDPKIIADDRLDALIIYATERYRNKINDLVDQLDIPNENYRQRLHFHALRHTDAEDMQALLQELIDGTSSSGSRSTSSSGGRRGNAPSAGPGAQPTVFGGGAEGSPVIIADTMSNSLIIHASPTAYDDIKDLIARLDQSRPQVLIETALVELSLNDTLQLGVELFTASDDIAIDTDGDGVFDTITQDRRGFGGSSFGLSETIFEDVGGVMVPTGRSPLIGTGVTAGVFNNGQLAGILTAFQNAGRAKILTMPSVVTNDNQRAQLELVRQTSFRETVRTDTGDSQDSFQTVEATTLLNISPHISSDNYLRLEIEQSVESFGLRPAPDAPPDVNTRRIETNVTIPDRFTVVLGGLIQEEQTSSVDKVPFLGDIPVLGFFFRSSTDTSSPQHLFLFVTPTILRDTETFSDYRRLSWERKLLQDDLFGQHVELRNTHFDKGDDRTTAEERIRRLERSGELDAARIKAPPKLEDDDREARKKFLEAREAVEGGEKPQEPEAEPEKEPEKDDGAEDDTPAPAPGGGAK